MIVCRAVAQDEPREGSWVGVETAESGQRVFCNIRH